MRQATGEQSLKILRKAALKAIVVDTVAGILPEQEYPQCARQYLFHRNLLLK
jgi:hypothetical protein